MRHRWINRHRLYGAWRSTGERCGIERDERFHLNFHYSEYRKAGSSEWIALGSVPPCEAGSQTNPVAQALGYPGSQREPASKQQSP